VVGNAVKAGVRFVSYDHFKYRLADSEVSLATNFLFEISNYFFQGKVTTPRSLLGTYCPYLFETELDAS
jgi:hypothetical protein